MFNRWLKNVFILMLSGGCASVINAAGYPLVVPEGSFPITGFNGGWVEVSMNCNEQNILIVGPWYGFHLSQSFLDPLG